VIQCSAILVQYRPVTNRQTDGRTDNSIHRTSIASRGNNNVTTV